MAAAAACLQTCVPARARACVCARARALRRTTAPVVRALSRNSLFRLLPPNSVSESAHRRSAARAGRAHRRGLLRRLRKQPALAARPPQVRGRHRYRRTRKISWSGPFITHRPWPPGRHRSARERARSGTYALPILRPFALQAAAEDPRPRGGGGGGGAGGRGHCGADRDIGAKEAGARMRWWWWWEGRALGDLQPTVFEGVGWTIGSDLGTKGV